MSFSAIFWTWSALCVLFFVRNEIVHRNHMRRIDEIHALNVALIDAGRNPNLDYQGLRGSYVSDLFNPLKWTYRQFYPLPPRVPG